MGLNFVAMANEIEDIFGIKVDVVPEGSIHQSLVIAGLLLSSANWLPLR